MKFAKRKKQKAGMKEVDKMEQTKELTDSRRSCDRCEAFVGDIRCDSCYGLFCSDCVITTYDKETDGEDVYCLECDLENKRRYGWRRR